MSVIHWVPLQMLILLVITSICIGIQNVAALWTYNWIYNFELYHLKQWTKHQNAFILSTTYLSLRASGHLWCGDTALLMSKSIYMAVCKKKKKIVFMVNLLFYSQACLQAVKVISTM